MFHEKSQFDTVNNYEGLRVQCDETECVFEFRTYKYTGMAPGIRYGVAPGIRYAGNNLTSIASHFAMQFL